jgi:excisionase family DNA binding protein
VAAVVLTGESAPRSPKRSNPGRHDGAPGPALLDVAAMATWLSVEVVFIRRLVAEHRIPFVKIGKFVRFDPDEVALWINAQRVNPTHRSSRTRTRNRG